MADASPFPPLADRWNDAEAASLDEPGLLRYRSNLLGADLAVTNFGGGNTSAKVAARDPLTGEDVTVLWVKGSGGDLGSMALDGFATLYQDRLLGLKSLYRGLEHEDEMVALFNHCIFGLNPRAPSIDTALHGFVPHMHVDHVHPDAVIAIAAAQDSEALTRDVFGGRLGYLPWQRPGFDLGLKLGTMAQDNPDLIGVVLGGHGLFTWADTARECYLTTMRIIREADAWLEANAKTPAFGGARVAARTAEDRARIASALMPAIRGRISQDSPKVGHFSDAPGVLDFVNADALDRLAPMGTSCPDHFLRTKIRPLVLPGSEDVAPVLAGLDARIEAYRT
ncbi:MAG: class II aldolase/adducin family protein, partial [Pseudomonadota bacterium]